MKRLMAFFAGANLTAFVCSFAVPLPPWVVAVNLTAFLFCGWCAVCRDGMPA